LEIVKAIVDSFPQVSLVVRAERLNGEPMWNLQKENVHVSEEGSDCDIMSIKPISKQIPFDIAIVLDRSSSITYDVMSYNRYRYRLVNYGSINQTKNVIKKLVSSFSDVDKFAIVGFSTRVDVVTALTRKHDSLVKVVSRFYANGITAFHDDVKRALQVVNEGDGIRVVVALTDGNDNSSRDSLRHVIQEAKQTRIPVYVVGLGDVNVTPLRSLATQTNGPYIFARNFQDLARVYKAIRHIHQAYCAISHSWENYDSNSKGRSVLLKYHGDSATVLLATASISLPESVLEYLWNRRRNIYFLGSALVVASFDNGIIVHRRCKNPSPDNHESTSV
jgi:Ca-activated chloride channel family protein